MNVFKCEKYGAVIVAFNRGHACKLLGKVLDERGIKLEKTDKVEKIGLEKAGVVMCDLPCAHEAWEEVGGSRTCVDCREHLGA